jgi:LysR family hca operon transcriptional activator
VVLEFFRRAGVDLKPEYEVHNVVHAIQWMSADGRLDPRQPQREQVPILKLLLSKIGKLAGGPA